MTTTTAAALAPAVTAPALWLIPALPLLGAAILLLLGRRANAWGHLLGCGTALAAFAVAAWQFVAMAGREAGDRAAGQTLFTWVSVGDLTVDFGLRLDELSMVFVLLVTGVGLLIHVYSIGYMAADPARRKFFAYLNLFLAAMLLLVLADNFLGLYLGWEGVGLVSYLLIGFWQHKPSAATAAKKAFLVNRVGDIGLGVALMVMATQLGTLSYEGVFSAIGGGGGGAGAGGAAVSSGLVTALGLLLLLGACAKSAQVPLQSWLGDAMEGPTPVSALIHAATMVTAGVYLITRSNPIFDATPTARAAVIAVGAVTLLFGAVIGCAKDDIKKVLAASTMSQVGYMVMAAGFGPAGYALAIMHLLTHGFFKAGLFLGAGSVMHGMNDEVDMRRYGALRAVMPITYLTFGIGYLAIIGVPPFAGFYSKEGIISAAFDQGGGSPIGYLLGAVALLGAGLTAFYMTRVMILTFFGPERWADGAHPHESPATMTAPMIAIAVGSVLSGALLAIGGRLQDWLAPVVGDHHPEHVLPVWLVTAASLIVVAAGIALAVSRYARSAIPTIAPAGSTLTRAARRDLYADDLNEAVFMRPGRALVAGTEVVDRRVVAGAATGVGTAIGELSARTRLLQSGLTRSYALYMLIGAALVIAAMLGGGAL
ncbi:NADH-quinone oxidoreductase subunit L [Dietzia sp. PP-33]|uniref:NADH-quinone oxidoreductase subunit L n=1 Tax=Dietzia sp. PP-33 TaxID=2957500 RepID=UPI0029BA8C36|nr:NADH-quinone oxidoreductase subunit L [Dietzia sp. PP-33]MDX2357201.1 NADH-quinone oxidoreductase subunit L [Dietzia sp. PP-33]